VIQRRSGSKFSKFQTAPLTPMLQSMKYSTPIWL